MILRKESIVHLQLTIGCKYSISDIHQAKEKYTKECFLDYKKRCVWNAGGFLMEYWKGFPSVMVYISACILAIFPTLYYLERLMHHRVHPRHVHQTVLPHALRLYAACCFPHAVLPETPYSHTHRLNLTVLYHSHYFQKLQPIPMLVLPGSTFLQKEHFLKKVHVSSRIHHSICLKNFLVKTSGWPTHYLGISLLFQILLYRLKT